ncbi:MAG: FHA domain-containing protein [Deltaproteobacteria bacterium]|nr:FHA domain-containing protein [Deltaproteobacteria bacterium]
MTIGELTSRIKVHAGPMTATEVLRLPRLVRKELEVPIITHGYDPLLVGRDENLARLVIDDTFISRTHAVIEMENGKFYLKDLHSKNGTYLNEKKLRPGERSPQPLRNGDRIRFNIVEFEFVSPENNL